MISRDGGDEKAHNGTFIFDSIHDSKANTGEGSVKIPVLGALQATFVRRKNIGRHISNI